MRDGNDGYERGVKHMHGWSRNLATSSASIGGTFVGIDCGERSLETFSYKGGHLETC